MLRGFVVGLIVGLAALAGLMVLFPSTAPAPTVPAAGVTEGAGATEGAGDAVAPDAATPGADEPEAETPAPADQGATPAESETAAAPEGAAPTSDPEGERTSDPVEAMAETPPEPPAVASTLTSGGDMNLGEHGFSLPTVAEPAATLKAPATDPAAQPAWRRNAVAFDDDGDRPLLAVVLTALPVAGSPNTPLGKIGAPVTLAVPARARADAETARIYRRAGFETLILLAFAPSAGGGLAPNLSDAEIAETVRQLIEDFDSVVGLANPGAPKNSEMRVARVVMRQLAEAGLGYLHAVGGAAGAEVRAAQENGVPLARHVRVIEPGLTVPQILQSLDLAAFDARRRGAAVAMGAPTEAMLTALIQWARDNNGRAARLAPFSAVLARLQRDG